MEYQNEIKFNEKGIRFSVKMGRHELIKIGISSFVGIAALIVISIASFILDDDLTALNVAVFSVLAAFILAFIVFNIIYLFYRRKYPYDIIIDDENLILRYKKGYAVYNKYEIGSVLMVMKNSSTAVQGAGDKNFEIYYGGISFYAGNKKINRRINEFEKLAYVIKNIAVYPESGINWGLAYDSRPENLTE